MNCDWLIEFDNKLGQYPEIQNLMDNKFHGSIEINFCSGIPMNYNLKLHRRAELKIDNPNLNKKEGI